MLPVIYFFLTQNSLHEDSGLCTYLLHTYILAIRVPQALLFQDIYLSIFFPNSRNEDGSENVVHNFGEKKENLPQYNSIKFLDLSHVRFKANSEEIPSETRNRYLSRILVMCPSLKKLSLQGLRISNQIFTHYISAKKTLTHLNLFACSGIIFV